MFRTSTLCVVLLGASVVGSGGVASASGPRDYEGPTAVEPPPPPAAPSQPGPEPGAAAPPTEGATDLADREEAPVAAVDPPPPVPQFETAKEWNAWARRERRRLKAERRELKAELKAIRNPKAATRRANLSTKREYRESQLRRAKKQDDTRREKKLAADLVKLNAKIAELDAVLSDVHDKKEELKANRRELDRTKNFRILPFIGPAYSPEMGFLVAGGLVSSWSPEPHNRWLPRSSLMASGGYSSTKAVVISGKLTSFFLDDRLRVYADVNYKDMADNYWGVGYDAARGPAQPNDSTAYNRQWWWVNPRILAQIDVRGLYVGLNFDYNFTSATGASPEIQADPDFIQFGPRNLNGGLGAVVMFDNRDVPQNAFGGVFGQISLTQYQRAFGSDNNYQVLDLDYRQYATLIREGSTLAWQLRSRMGFGNVPWSDMSLLGSPFDLRAYRWGRYRDKSMFFGLVEYRFMFARRTPAPDGRTLSRHGLVAWVGTGTLGEDITQWTRWLPNGGLGYRVTIQPRMNLRFDFGIGDDTTAFYLNFTEAF